MRRRYSIKWVDAQLADGGYSTLLDLIDAYRAPPQHAPSLPDFGLPSFAFVLTEAVEWAAASLRSGVVTYYEAVAANRQRAMLRSLNALKALKMGDLSKWYALGLNGWKNKTTREKIDGWLAKNFDALVNDLYGLARANRDTLLELTA